MLIHAVKAQYVAKYLVDTVQYCLIVISYTACTHAECCYPALGCIRVTEALTRAEACLKLFEMQRLPAW